MRKFLLRIFVFAVAAVSSSLSCFSASQAETVQGEFLPLSPVYLEWLKEQEKSENPSVPYYSDSGIETYPTGDIPSPIDLSHLEDNPPRLDDGNSLAPVYYSAPIPSKYDLRDVDGKRYVPSVKNQSSYGTCWAFASIGAMESSYLKSIGGYTSGDPDPVDLSEMHLAWFTFRNADASKVFDYSTMKKKKFNDIMDHGGYSDYAVALYSRLDGPVAESSVPYRYTEKDFKARPEAYERVLMLRASYPVSYPYDTKNEEKLAEAKNIIKQLVMDSGSMYVGYTHNGSSYKTTSSGGTSYYSESGGGGGHAVQVIGWDDNYSRNNFASDPGMDGAWLMKNSWGSWWGDSGYFWMSYAQKLHGITAFIAEKTDGSMRAYCYTPMGWTSTWGNSGQNQVYAANIFKSVRDDEYLTDVGFYTYTNNLQYEIEIHSDMGNSVPSSPVSGGNITSGYSGNMPYAGYHTVTLANPVKLTKGEYFSVILKTIGTGYSPVERSYNDDTVTEYGSFFSYDGETWTAGGEIRANACIRAFTVTESTATPPAITANIMPKGSEGDAYSVSFSAEGTQPVTWSIAEGALPSGLSLDAESGVISGIPVTAGNSSFTIRAENEAGFDTAEYTIEICQLPAIMETSFTGYMNYAFNETLTLSRKTKAEWSISGTLPNGLTLSKSSGKITGTPKAKGTFNVSVTAELSSTDKVTENVTFNINPKPTAAKIGTSSFKAGTLEQYFDQEVKVSGTEPITLAVEDLPEGLTFNKNTRKITGVPLSAGTYSVKITASNIVTETESKTVVKMAKLQINGSKPAITGIVSLDDAMVGKAYKSVQVYAAGSYPMTWSASGLPSGITLSKSGLLSGTPKGTPKTYNVTFKVSNSGGKDQFSVPLNVVMKPELSTKKLNAANTDKKYSAKLSAKGSTPISWDITGLPDDFTVTLGNNGTSATIAGTTEKAGWYTVNITMSNSAGSYSTRMLLEVKGVAPKITASLAKGETDTAYTGSKIAVTGTKPVTITCGIDAKDRTKFGIISIQAIGLSFSADKTTGIASITGTPTKAVKSLPITITATNGYGKKPAAKKVSLTITGTSAKDIVFETPGTPEVDAVPETQEPSAVQESDRAIYFGAERLPDSVGTRERRVLDAEGWIIAAVLPEISADVSGMYDFSVTLSDDAETGAVLGWFAFPQDSEGSDDDAIAEFYSMDGTETDRVPEDRRITVSVWLNEGITYAPVIAVKQE